MLLDPRAMRAAILLAFAACATETPVPQPPLPLDTVWAQTIHAGDLIVLVPGTGSYDYLAAPIEALPGKNPIVDPRKVPKVGSDAIVFEQAIAAAHRAGVDPTTLTYVLWGAGFTKDTAFTYVSYEGLNLPIEVLGGENSCATGLIVENLIKYSVSDATADATDLQTRLGSYLAAHPATPDVIISAHSWGGAVAEYFVQNMPDHIAFAIAAGVPGMIPDYAFTGPGLREFNGIPLLEIDRPDDPVHQLNPSGYPGGHQYVILFGDQFMGSYGVTTEQLSCNGVPGQCGM
jgi:hypothetical protein